MRSFDLIKKFNQSILNLNFKIAILLLVLGIFFANPGNVIKLTFFDNMETVRIGLVPLITMLSGILYGPLIGIILGGIIDVFAVLIWYGIEDYIISFTLSTMLRGFLAGYIYNNIFKSKFNLKNIIASIFIPYLIVSVLINSFLLYKIYDLSLIDNLILRITVQGLVVPVYIFITYFILKLIENQKELKLLNEKLKKILRKDDLTGLFNRKAFMEYFNKMKSLSQRHSKTLCLIIADIDKFKDINDTYGHHTGDEVLKALGDIFKSEVRNEDMVARIGGEEFAILLIETNVEKAVNVAERIRVKISQLEVKPVKKTITASFGVSQMKEDESIKELFCRADNALYEAKKTGRNKTVIKKD